MIGVYSQINDDPLVLGNPSNARTDVNQPDDYLVVHPLYTLSYNRSQGKANWVAWHLQKSDIGKADRTNAFAPDQTLPRDWWILPSDYNGSGYDRGHMCPSKDRSDTEENNALTFLMSNMQPQSPKLNRKTWEYLENYTREQVGRDSEAYIYAGCYGNQGSLKGKVIIPTDCWKIIVLVPLGDNDLNRLNENTRIIAVDMPNNEQISERWRKYLTNVNEIEQKTGFNFLSNVPATIRLKLKAKIDAAEDDQGSSSSDSSSAPVENPNTNNTDNNGKKYILGPKGGCYYLNDSGKKVYVDKAKCQQ